MLKNYKLILITAVITTAIIIIAFVTGTFYPNKWTKQKIEKIFHKAEVKEAVTDAVTDAVKKATTKKKK